MRERTVEDHCLIGILATVMDGAVLESNVMLGAGSLVPAGKVLEGGYVWMGTPAKWVPPLTDQELEFLTYSAERSASLKDRHRELT